MRADKPTPIVLLAGPLLLLAGPIAAQTQAQDSTPTKGAETFMHDPPLLEGQTLDEALDAAAKPPPASWPDPIHDNPVLSFTMFELLEQRLGDNRRDELAWDTQGWIGNDDHKFWWKSEGEASLDGPDEGEADLQMLYASPLSAFWYLQAGVRYDNAWTTDGSRDRVSAVLGLQGLAPYKFDLEPSLYLTNDGDLLGQLTASYDLYLTQRLALQPRTELNLSAGDLPEYGIGAGFNDIALELRLRYEIKREFAPYIGIRYFTLLGETGNIAESNGESADDIQLFFGIRLAF